MLKKMVTFLGLSFLLVTFSSPLPARPFAYRAFGAAPPPAARISPQVRQELARLAPDEMLTVIVTFEEQARLTGLANTSRAGRRQNVIQTLQSHSRAGQQRVFDRLSVRMQQGQAGQVIPFWIFNGMAVTATRQVIEELANFPEVLNVSPNLEFDAPQVVEQEFSLAEANLNAVNAPEVWDMGYRGQDVVVANLDTGVDLEHPDLKAGWRGGSNSWFDPHGEHPDLPADVNGHGTWTMGLMVGGNTSGAFIGVAPEAKWIAAKIFNDSGYATSAAIHQAFQWLLDPDGDPTTDDAPHVINNSWSFLSIGCFMDFQEDLKALRAAGILPIFAAGNSGPDSRTSVSPSNYPEAFAIGAVDNYGVINTASSRGPSSCGEPETIYPQLVAPGVNIQSTGLMGGYSRATGTSLAAPHVAGSLALILSAYPGLSVEEQEAALLRSATDLGEPGADSIYGHGSLDVLGAYRWVQNSSPVVIPETGATNTHFIFMPALVNTTNNR